MKMKFIAILFLFYPHVQFAQEIPDPGWTKDLIIYEISTKNFNTSDEPGSGNFQSVRQKIPYLTDLGINGVWISGHNWANDHHFYGIWTQYATIRPDSLDPSLGGPSDFKEMVEDFHKNGIRVFLDVITHGVMSESPLITEHPQWFKDGSWGMIDYDWNGGHKDLDDWWVRTWVNYVLKYGVDGYRLDVDIYRPDLWIEIRNRCAAAGHPIVVFLENPVKNNNACDFFQRRITISNQTLGIDTSLLIGSNAARFFRELPETEKFTDIYYYSVQLSSHDDGWESFPSGNNPYVAEGSRCLFGYSFLFTPAIPLFMSGEEFNAEFVPQPGLTPDLYGKDKSGTGTWLYGSELMWDQLNRKTHIDMLKDVRKMISIRKSEKDLFHASSNDSLPDIFPLNFDSPTRIPVPFVIQNNDKLIIVAGNNTLQKATCRINLDPARVGLIMNRSYRMYDLWNNKRFKIKGKELRNFTFTIQGDKTAGGGIAIFKIIK
jgi:hypothetical protein